MIGICHKQPHIRITSGNNLFQNSIQFCLVFPDEAEFWENFVSPCLNAPIFNPLPTKMLVTPILETCQFQVIQISVNKEEEMLDAIFTESIFLSSSSKKRMELKGTPVLWILWKCCLVWPTGKYFLGNPKKVY